MRVPADRTLAQWIRELDASGKLYLFYNSPEWKALAAEVIDDHHGECVDCVAVGDYSRAVTVHHEYEVREHPDMALTRYVEDEAGERREVLHPLCNKCHNKRHHRFCGKAPSSGRFVNIERW